MAAERIGQLQQVPGVFTRVRARCQHAIVAGQLPLDTQAARDPPHTRMRPIERARDGGHHLRQTIVPADVRELVKENRAAAILGPRVGDRRNEDPAVRIPKAIGMV